MTKDDITLRNAKNKLSTKFDKKDMGLVKWLLGVNADERPDGVFMSQTSYVWIR